MKIEDIVALEKRCEQEDALLLKHGWTKTPDGWMDPNNEMHRDINAYSDLTLVILKERGWRSITEKRHHNWDDSVELWCRFQSPTTKRLYSFLDAQYIMESEWDESGYPEKCCGVSKMLTDLVGSDFTGDTIETLFLRLESGECELKWWNNDGMTV